MSREARANLLLFITAIVWGLGFIAQKFGANNMPPFYFNAIRFAIGCFAIFPVLLYTKRKHQSKPFEDSLVSKKKELILGFVTGFFIFAGSACQQIGIAYTSVGNAAFLTACYIIIVPILSIFLGQKIQKHILLAALLTLIGLYFLTITGDFDLAYGDLIIFLGSFLWAGHILSVDYSAKRMSPVKLAFLQFLFCCMMNFLVALFCEVLYFQDLINAMLSLFYSGFISAGLGFTLQLVGQKYAKPTPASLILSLEIIFALIFGMIFFHEIPTLRGAIGAILMFTGIILAQIGSLFRSKKTAIL